MKKIKKITISLLFLTFILLSMLNKNVYATKPMRRYLYGINTYDIIFEDNDTSILLEKQIITYNIDDIESTSSYDVKKRGNVSVEYTLNNPSDIDTTQTIFLPVFKDDGSNNIDVINEISENLHVFIENEEIETKIRHIETNCSYDEINFYLDKLNDDIITCDEIDTNLKVYTAIYKINKPFAGLVLGYDYKNDDQIKGVIINNSYTETIDKFTIRKGIIVNNEDEIVVTFVGKDLSDDFMNNAITYQSLSFETISPEKITLTKKEVKEETFYDYVISKKPNKINITDVDWYNIVINKIKKGYIDDEFNYKLLTEYIIQLCEFDISIRANSSIKIKIDIPVFPTVDLLYSPAKYIFDYKYNTSLKKTSSFGCRVDIITNAYVLDDTFIDIISDKTLNKYSCIKNKNGDSDQFSICEVENPKFVQQKSFFNEMLNVLSKLLVILGFTMVMIAFTVVIVGIIICAKSIKKRYNDYDILQKASVVIHLLKMILLLICLIQLMLCIVIAFIYNVSLTSITCLLIVFNILLIISLEVLKILLNKKFNFFWLIVVGYAGNLLAIFLYVKNLDQLLSGMTFHVIITSFASTIYNMINILKAKSKK